MNKHISRFGLGLIILSLTVVASAQIVDQEPQLKLLPKLETRPASERHLFGTKMTVNVSVDAKGNVTAVNSVDGPGWICPGIEMAEIRILRTAAKTVALKAKFNPKITGGKRVSSTSIVEIEFPVQATAKSVVGAVVRGDADIAKDSSNSNRRNETNAESDSVGKSSPRSPTNADASRRISHPFIGSVLTHTVLEMPQPKYPSAARAVRATGSVRVEVLIGEDGMILSSEPTSGHPLLRSAARIAACGARFKPITLSNNPVKVSGIITYNFVP